MTNFIDFSDSVVVRKSPFIDYARDVSIRNPYYDLLDLVLKRVKDADSAYGKVCCLYYMLKFYFSIDLHRRYGGMYCHDGRNSMFFYYYFLILLKRSAMRKDEILKTEAADIVGSHECKDGICPHLCPIQAELIRKGKLPDGVSADVFKEIAKTPLEDWIDNQDVMNIFHISLRTLQTLRSNGTIKFSKFGNKIYYRRQDIQNILAENYTMFDIKNEYGKKRKKMTV